MTIEIWFIYLLLVITTSLTPGPTVFFMISNTTLYGYKKAIFISLGNITGLLFLGIISVTGLGTILQTSEFIFNIIKYIGAIYLVYLGIKLILQKNLNSNNMPNKIDNISISGKKLYLQSFAVSISNPKGIILLIALFPQFINSEQSLIPQFFILIGTLMFVSFSALMAYALFAERTKNLLKKQNRIKIMNKTVGTIFIGFGALLATSSNK